MRKNLLLLFASTALCFLALEVGLRVVYGNPSPFLFPQVQHVQMPYGYKLVANQRGSYTLDKPVRTNAYGFRDGDWDMPKPVGRFRVMTIGDSFTFGNNASEEDGYPATLERLLQASLPDAEVVNTGIGGWNIDNETEFFITEGVEYEPNVLVFGFFNNDYGDPDSEIYIPPLSSDLRLESRPGWLRWVPYRVLFLIKRSAVVVYLRDWIAVVRASDDTWQRRLFRNEIDLDSDPRVQFTYKQLLRVKDACDQRGIQMVLVVLPSVNTFWIERGSLAFVDHLKDFVESHGIHFADLSEGLWEMGDTNRFFGYPWDNHYTAAGHRLIATQLLGVVLPIATSQQADIGLGPGSTSDEGAGDLASVSR